MGPSLWSVVSALSQVCRDLFPLSRKSGTTQVTLTHTSSQRVRKLLKVRQLPNLHPFITQNKILSIPLQEGKSKWLTNTECGVRAFAETSLGWPVSKGGGCQAMRRKVFVCSHQPGGIAQIKCTRSHSGKLLIRLSVYVLGHVNAHLDTHPRGLFKRHRGWLMLLGG